MAKEKLNTIYSAFNIARAAEGKNPFTFRHGSAELRCGAYATFKQWNALGYRIGKGCAGSPVYSTNADGKITCYKVWNIDQVKRTQNARISAEELRELIARTEAAGMIHAENVRQKYGELNAEELARAYNVTRERYEQQRAARKNERGTEAQARRILDTFRDVYTLFYDHRELDAMQEMLVPSGEALLKDEAELVGTCARLRQDLFVSDRELAAMYVAFRVIVYGEADLLERLKEEAGKDASFIDVAEGGADELLPIM